MVTLAVGITIKDALTLELIEEELMVALLTRLVVNVSEDAVTTGSGPIAVDTTVAFTKMETARIDAVTHLSSKIETILMRLKHVAFAEVDSRSDPMIIMDLM